MKKINIYLILIFLGSMIIPSAVFATSAVVNGLNATVSEGLLGGDQVTESSLAQAGVVSSLQVSIGKAVATFLALLGILFLVLMIYGGFIWMIARGNEQEVEKAKNLIQSAVIGLIIIISAYAVTIFLSNSILNVA